MQLVLFGLSNQVVVTFKEENTMTFKNLFLKDYDESTDDSFAVYTQKDVYEHMFYTVDQVSLQLSLVFFIWLFQLKIWKRRTCYWGTVLSGFCIVLNVVLFSDLFFFNLVSGLTRDHSWTLCICVRCWSEWQCTVPLPTVLQEGAHWPCQWHIQYRSSYNHRYSIH